MSLLLQLLLNAAVNASLYALLAVGFGIVYRSLRFFHLAFGALYIVASYATFAGVRLMGMPPALCLAFGLLATIILSEAINRGIYLPLERRGAQSGVLLIASLGIYILTVNTIALIFGNEVKILSQGIEPSYALGTVVITRIQLMQFIIGWLCIAAFWLFTKTNILMKGIWAMGETPNLIIVLGLPYELLRTLAFSLSSLFAGIASILVAMDIGITPYAGMQALLTGAIAVIVGGVDVFWGWILSAVILSLLQSIAVWQFSARWNDLITFGLLIVTLIFRPQGLFSPKKRREEF